MKACLIENTHSEMKFFLRNFKESFVSGWGDHSGAAPTQCRRHRDLLARVGKSNRRNHAQGRNRRSGLLWSVRVRVHRETRGGGADGPGDRDRRGHGQHRVRGAARSGRGHQQEEGRQEGRDQEKCLQEPVPVDLRQVSRPVHAGQF